jgi:phospholipid/cholesterol/gamma-HCH transport system permease protein
MISRTGREIREAVEQAGFTIRVLALALLHVPGVFVRRRAFRELLRQMYLCGVKALFVTSVMALFMGMILALQAGIQLKKYGNADPVGLVVAATMCRELGPFIAGLILTAMVGSTIAAEIGTMKVSEEIDALEVMSIDPIRLLVTPRVIALTLMTFVLTVHTDLVGVLGGGIVAKTQLGVPFHRYLDFAKTAVEGRGMLSILPKDIYTGLIKATVACGQGLSARGGALGVGQAVRKTVVACVMLILILGYVLTSFFYR